VSFLSVEPQIIDVDGEAKWTFRLHNNGDDDLRQVTVRRGLTLLDEPFDLAAGKERHFTFTTTYKTEGRKTERVTVSGIASSGKSMRDEASATVQARPPRPVTPKPEPVPKPKPPAKPAPDVLTITSPIHLELVRVPAGEFLMGSDPAKDEDADDHEQPQHRVYVSEFYIGKYPVTNAQFAAFVQDTGYQTIAEKEGWGGIFTVFLKKKKEIKGANWQHPRGPKSNITKKDDHPVVQISWRDAVVFCQWLSQRTGQPYRLPTEAEWEKAARGTDGRKYPWGNTWNERKLNSEEGGPGDTTPVGQYSPSSDSPYGAADMSGNVWEWCADWFDEKEYQRRAKSTVKDPQGPEKGTFRVQRGGSFYWDASVSRCSLRDSDTPDFRNMGSGFRVVLAPVPSGP